MEETLSCLIIVPRELKLRPGQAERCAGCLTPWEVCVCVGGSFHKNECESLRMSLCLLVWMSLCSDACLAVCTWLAPCDMCVFAFACLCVLVSLCRQVCVTLLCSSVLLGTEGWYKRECPACDMCSM